MGYSIKIHSGMLPNTPSEMLLESSNLFWHRYIFILYISKDSLKNLCHNGSTSMANLCKLMGSGFPNFGFSLTVMHMNKIDEIIKPIIFYFAIIAI